MNKGYYVHHPAGIEGPFDLTMMLRKVRGGRLNPGSTLSTTDDSSERLASEIPEIAELFTDGHWSVQERSMATAGKLLAHALITGWRFVGMQPIAFVFSSAGVMASFGIGLMLTGFLPWQAGVAAGICLYLVLHAMVMVVVLRLYRGQYLDAQFLRSYIPPLIAPLAVTALMSGMLGIFGLISFIFPGILLFSLFAFAPFLVADRGLGPLQSLQKSATLAIRSGRPGLGAIMVLMTLNLLSILLIVTLPITMPVISAALADIYDEYAHQLP